MAVPQPGGGRTKQEENLRQKENTPFFENILPGWMKDEVTTISNDEPNCPREDLAGVDEKQSYEDVRVAMTASPGVRGHRYGIIS
ncbi:hypothetical protein PoB_006643700 [Plakobranchus ocellatus]|uniref:Uncharacterized protein n=1 Tax=Plakobranchus ocellatus TaxID=259542 RepID=A0AAV4D6S4_9GAST|nr:hypothetical protein PoB_006643700 [Plakobranchus ocellatus]